MRLLPRTLGGQLTGLLLAALVLAQSIAMFVVFDERQQVARQAFREESLARTASVVRLLEETPPNLHLRVLTAASSRWLRYWVATDSAAEEPADAIERQLASDLTKLLGARPGGAIRVQLFDSGGWAPWHWRPWWRGGHDHSMRWHVGDDPAEEDEPGDSRRHPIGLAIAVPLADGTWLNLQTAARPAPGLWAWPPLLSLLLMAAAILLIVALMVRHITRPLRALADAAERFGRGEEVAPVAEGGPEEVRRSTAAFNAMRERLARFVQDRTRLLAAISHDLRTPITLLRLRAEMLDDDDAKRRLLETLDEMQRMTEATLAFARDDAAAEPTRQVDLAALIDSLADDMAEMGQDVTFAEATRLAYPCRPAALKRALRNLIENAVRFGRRARIVLAPDADGPRITIDDDGPGIPPDKLDQVFEPFVRLEESRSGETGGVGLGLAIARSIIRAHGGDVSLANRPEGGLRAEVRLPAA